MCEGGVWGGEGVWEGGYGEGVWGGGYGEGRVCGREGMGGRVWGGGRVCGREGYGEGRVCGFRFDLGADVKAHKTPGVEDDGVPDNTAYGPATERVCEREGMGGQGSGFGLGG